MICGIISFSDSWNRSKEWTTGRDKLCQQVNACLNEYPAEMLAIKQGLMNKVHEGNCMEIKNQAVKFRGTIQMIPSGGIYVPAYYIRMTVLSAGRNVGKQNAFRTKPKCDSALSHYA